MSTMTFEEFQAEVRTVFIGVLLDWKNATNDATGYSVSTLPSLLTIRYDLKDARFAIVPRMESPDPADTTLANDFVGALKEYDEGSLSVLTDYAGHANHLISRIRPYYHLSCFRRDLKAEFPNVGWGAVYMESHLLCARGYDSANNVDHYKASVSDYHYSQLVKSRVDGARATVCQYKLVISTVADQQVILGTGSATSLKRAEFLAREQMNQMIDKFRKSVGLPPRTENVQHGN